MVEVAHQQVVTFQKPADPLADARATWICGRCIRLLIPPGSRLLELQEIRDRDGREQAVLVKYVGWGDTVLAGVRQFMRIARLQPGGSTREPGTEVRDWTRRNGYVSLKVVAGSAYSPDQQWLDVGLPFGPKPRLRRKDGELRCEPPRPRTRTGDREPVAVTKKR